MLWLLACSSPMGERPLPSSDSEPVEVQDSPSETSSESTSESSSESPSETEDTGQAWVRPDRPDTKSPPPDASWRFGGGVDYPDTIDPSWPIVTRVSTLAGLKSALEGAQSGDIVWVEGTATLDFSGESVCVPGGVTLASDRGLGPGALLTTSETRKVPILKPCGDEVRITGFRIRGADDETCPDTWPNSCSGSVGSNCRDCEPTSIGIQVNHFDGLEVDNNELTGWSFAATWFTDSVGNSVHHNHIHHNQREGLGYGVVLTRGGDEEVVVDIHHNRFDYNRHAVAGSGEPGQDYDAWQNLALPHANGHVFDMHGENENTDNGSVWAGGDIRVHENIVLPTTTYALVVRGKPQHGSWLYDNCLARSSGNAQLQKNFTGNFHQDTDPSGASAPNSYSKDKEDCGTVRVCLASGAQGPWAYGVAAPEGQDLLIGDLDGDGRDDLFRTTGSEWQWSRSGTVAWAKRNTSSATSLVLGDFDGDGQDDVFSVGGGGWRISKGASASWTSWNSLSDPLSALAFGDFDGDGRTDAFRTSGGQWQWSSGAQGAWTKRNTSGTTLEKLAFADVDGDGKTDVLTTSGGTWKVSYAGSGSWQTLNTSSLDLTSMLWADVDGDGRDDAVRRSGSSWVVSLGGSSGWQTWRVSSESPLFGDFDGDGADDALMLGCL